MEKRHIVLIGFMGAGKTTVGRQLAEALNLPFVDSDEWIELREGLTVSKLFEEKGEAYFRAVEREFLEELKSKEPSVVAVGGGLPCVDNNIKVLKELGLVIYLNVSLLTVLKRLKEEQLSRPLIAGVSGSDLHRFVEDLLSERVTFYKQADLFVPNESSSINKVVESIQKDISKLNIQFK
jgi:shikimate kinase